MANRQITITEANNGGFVVYIHGSYDVHGAYANAHDLANALHEWACPAQPGNIEYPKSNRFDGSWGPGSGDVLQGRYAKARTQCRETHPLPAQEFVEM